MQLFSSQASAALLRTSILACLLSLAGCQSTGPRLTSPESTPGSGGFSIQENSSIGLRARSAFDEANRAIEAGDRSTGIQILEKLLESEPQFVAAQINLGIALRESDELSRAQEALQAAVELNERHPVAHNELGIVFRRQGEFEKAKTSYQTALDLRPDFHFSRMNLAVLCDLYLADLQCALNHYRILKKSDPANEKAEIWIADLENRIGQGEN